MTELFDLLQLIRDSIGHRLSSILKSKHEHIWDSGTLIDFGRNKMWCCTCKDCKATKFLY